MKDSIGGNNKTIMIANIWPEDYHLEETISTLKFATVIPKKKIFKYKTIKKQRMMKVSNDATV